ncbi:MAG: carbohydrate-binding protein, partial [Planctomycetota bacterium]
MSIESCPPRRGGPLAPVACLAVWCVAFPAARTEAASLVIPAWSFARGNARVHADPGQYADAGPVVEGGPRRPWGWTVEYDIDIPVTAKYTLQVCYAAAEARPMEVFLDNENLVKCCAGVTFGPASSARPPALTWKSSGARWERVCRPRSETPLELSITGGKHTVMFTRRGPLPHLVALRLETPTAFPDGWKPPRYKVRHPDGIPAAYRKAFLSAREVNVAALPPPIKDATRARGAGSLTIPACTFDRGNARIYANPDEYADAGPFVGGGPGPLEEAAVEYDVDFPVGAEYTLHFRYSAAQARPVDVFLDGRNLGKGCTGVTFGSARFERPVRSSWTSRSARWEGLQSYEEGRLLSVSVTEGKHTLKIARRGPLP